MSDIDSWSVNASSYNYLWTRLFSTISETAILLLRRDLCLLIHKQRPYVRSTDRLSQMPILEFSNLFILQRSFMEVCTLTQYSDRKREIYPASTQSERAEKHMLNEQMTIALLVLVKRRIIWLSVHRQLRKRRDSINIPCLEICLLLL